MNRVRAMKKRGLKQEITYELHRWKKELLIADKIITVIVLLLTGIFTSADIVLMVSFFLLFPYLILTKRKSLIYNLLLAFFVALIWSVISINEYVYNQGYMLAYGINLYTLFAWTLGLFALYVIYSHYEHCFDRKSLLIKLLFFVAIYWPLFIAAEAIAYHLFNVHNIANGVVKGLPLCDCVHAPAVMMIGNFSLGIIYFLACKCLRLKNPHYRRRG